MSVQKEDKKSSSSSGRGLGLAAAAIGVGVGAALYYFLSRTDDNQTGEGSTRTEWGHQERQALTSSPSPVDTALNNRNTELFRKRSWSLEECSICIELMMESQPIQMLPCGHKFHVPCVHKWLSENGICPNCRKAAE